MIENVFRPSRIVEGKKIKNRLYVGRYALEKGQKPVRVALNTPDKLVAEKRLREIVIEKQREAEGILAPKSIREAVGTKLGVLVDEYEKDLASRGCARKHVHDTSTRLRRVFSDTGWRLLGDVRADRFLEWR